MCTGEPNMPPKFFTEHGVYPRVYGGTLVVVGGHYRTSGLSPCVRGNRSHSPRRAASPGSIPVCTGEPQVAQGLTDLSGVYPRVYGGTVGRVSPSFSRTGLSPCVRGNRRGRGGCGAGLGSIPVCTGEPAWLSASAPSSTVYPRVYGGTPAPTPPGPPQ